jgi:hypothetical protein
MTLPLPEPVAALLRGGVHVGEPAQAFPFLTVDESGAPHVALVSGQEAAVGADGSLLVVLGSPTTRANLLRSGRATLVAVEGVTAHSVKLALRRSVEDEGLLAAVLDVTSHKADSVGVPLSPIGYVPTDELVALEHWDRSSRVLDRLRG